MNENEYQCLKTIAQELKNIRRNLERISDILAYKND